MTPKGSKVLIAAKKRSLKIVGDQIFFYTKWAQNESFGLTAVHKGLLRLKWLTGFKGLMGADLKKISRLKFNWVLSRVPLFLVTDSSVDILPRIKEVTGEEEVTGWRGGYLTTLVQYTQNLASGFKLQNPRSELSIHVPAHHFFCSSSQVLRCRFRAPDTSSKFTIIGSLF